MLVYATLTLSNLKYIKMYIFYIAMIVCPLILKEIHHL